MECADKTLVRLIITSRTFTAEEITQSICLNPDASWKIGDQHPKVPVTHKTNGWCLQSEFDNKTPLESKVESVLMRLAPVAKNISELPSSAETLFSCVIYSDHRPALFFDKSTMAQITALGASLDIDLYILPVA